MEPLVSVCIPTYNNPEGLMRTLECITRQTYKNLEIIVSDNCSQNPLVEQVLLEFFETDGRVLYWRQSHDIGVDKNYRFTVDHAFGKYFMFAQDDDWWTPNYIEVLVGELEKHPNVPVAASPSQYRTSDGKISPTRWLNDVSAYNAIGNGSLGFVCMGMWRRGDFLKYEVRLPQYVLGGDHITVAHAILGSGEKPIIDARASYIKGYRDGRFQICFNNDFWYSFRSWYWMIALLLSSEHITTRRKMLLPIVAATNFIRACGVTAIQMVVSLPEGNYARRIIQKKFFGAN